MIPIDKVENIVSRFNELESILAKPDLKKDEFVSNSKEYSNLNEIISYAKNYLKVLEDLKSTKNILEDKSTDKEFYEMAEKELKDLKQQEEECVKRLKVFLLPKDEADEKNAIIENLLEDIKNDIPNTSFSQVDMMAKSLSKSLAIKTGTKLDLKEQEDIVNKLFLCKQPDSSPFGKRTFVTVNIDEIDKKFNN